jgi:hypothetical protein
MGNSSIEARHLTDFCVCHIVVTNCRQLEIEFGVVCSLFLR